MRQLVAFCAALLLMGASNYDKVLEQIKKDIIEGKIKTKP